MTDQIRFMPTYIIIADDHPLFRTALISLLTRLPEEFIIDEADSFQDLIDLLKTKVIQPDLVLLDLKLPDINGLDGLLSLKKSYSELPVAVISAFDERSIIKQTRQYGASGFISKSMDSDSMTTRIMKILQGDLCFPDCSDADCNDKLAKGFKDLTPVQMKVLHLLKEGKPSKTMADSMGVTEATIKAHLTTIFRKLGVRNRTQAVIAANQLELPDGIQPDVTRPDQS
ncbi:response regulator transcription factor [Solemya velum gill symbiont]|uniref:Response regulator n=2 Tax=Solemya velum gill symbiont TaxID=2340 RepID=A0A0B0H7F9_SOVGS|nr:response regulator transcription factor [Solemya velum gill symbiont]KHF25045.1 response regulator [Solemya velum gill symbiont]